MSNENNNIKKQDNAEGKIKNEMVLEHGSETEHLETLRRAIKNDVDYVWSGDLRRNPYIAENLNYAIENDIIEITPRTGEQESGFNIHWLKTDF